MNAWRRPRVNLAGRPLRNRRFFTAAFAAVVLLFLLVAVPSGLWLVRSASRSAADNRASAAADERLYAAEGERNDFARRAEALRKNDREIVGHVNAVIARKAFSVVEFFALLEEALPAGSYLTSLSPVGEGDGRIEARFKVVTGGLSELMSLMTKLESLKFKNLAIKGETQMGGQLVSEIGLTYERAR
jgi:uncharacterized membrane protein